VTLDELRTLLDYHYWARDRVFAALDGVTPEQYTRDLGSSFPSVRDTLVHVYSADWIWHCRWHGESPRTPIPFDRYPDVASLRRAWQELEAQYRSSLENEGPDGLTRVLGYTLLNGQQGTGILWQVIQHVVNHASYHRGQVTTMLRQLGAPPPKSLDLIAFYRDRQSTARAT
jgi:uncharacterized damage-inducible protein DinB